MDNVGHPLQSDFLCQALTQQVLKIRVLGLSRIIETPVYSAIYATGNNLIIDGDLCRRTLLCLIDAKVERPELRPFSVDALEFTRGRRAALVIAGLTILLAYRLSQRRGEGGIGLESLGSFEMWSSWVRDALIWAGCPADPCATMARIQAESPKRNDLELVLAQWRKHIGEGVVMTTEQVVERAEARWNNPGQSADSGPRQGVL
jgi:putative DNA primase/helicase